MESYIAGIPELFPDLAQVRALPQEDRYLDNGNPIYRSMVEEPDLWQEGTQVRMYKSSGEFVGIFRCDKATEKFAPVKIVFAGLDKKAVQMKYITDTLDFALDRRSAVTLGKFDGLHRGTGSW